MKFYATFALALLPFVFANPIAEPGPFAEAAELAESDGPPATLAEDFDSGSLDKRQSCYVSGREAGLNGAGTCQYNSFGHRPYVSVTGFCPTPADYQCCRAIRCSGQYSGYMCRNTYKGCGSDSRWVTGFCPGPSTIRCCVN